MYCLFVSAGMAALGETFIYSNFGQIPKQFQADGILKSVRQYGCPSVYTD